MQKWESNGKNMENYTGILEVCSGLRVQGLGLFLPSRFEGFRN